LPYPDENQHPGRPLTRVSSPMSSTTGRPRATRTRSKPLPTGAARCS